MSNYILKNDSFVINDFDRQKPFASFLPGVAGLRGIPIWAFYVNRGQAISSFGLRDKNGAILEFFPANTAYMYVDKIGFRTFVKINGQVEELFKANNTNVQRSMIISPHQVTITEKNHNLNLHASISYFILPNENFGGLVRNVQITDLNSQPRKIEILDGISQILPSGIDYGGYKAVSNILRSWMDVENLDNDVAFYKLRSSTADSAIVEKVHDGNFYFSIVGEKLVKPITDCDLIFDYDTSLSEAVYFKNHDLDEIYNCEQVTQNKVPCGYTGVKWNTQNQKTLEINTIIGYTKDIELINKKANEYAKSGNNFIHLKQIEAQKVIEQVTDVVKTKTAIPVFDEYIKQNYLDNILRGGHPLVFKGSKKNLVYHIYSRKHGDLERDYNFFTIAPEYYSQGNGNFRDVCQNRRNDVLINSQVEDYNIHVFGNLIQADGYNPLGVNGSTFVLNEGVNLESLLGEIGTNLKLKKVLTGKFSPGKIVTCIEDENIVKLNKYESVLSLILQNSTQLIEADFGEGYWQDHWTYILDLIENYLSVYPDKIKELLYGRNDYRFYSSSAYVLPRRDKFVLTTEGQVRQYDAILHDHEKIKVTKMTSGSNWLKDENHNEVKTNLFGKLLVLAVNKYCCLDPEGVGVSYEANKPGWNDAMNGVPGLFGSGVGETIELYRLLEFLADNLDNQERVLLPIELVDLVNDLKKINTIDSYTDWDLRSNALERYRERVRFFTKTLIEVSLDEFKSLVKNMLAKVKIGLNKAYEIGQGIYPTYLLYEANEYEEIFENNQLKKTPRGLVNVKVKKFNQVMLPHFLEAPARALKADLDFDKKYMYEKIRQTDMFDEVFKFYKTSGDLNDVTLETGRIVAFTKGWFERESNFLHMTYKYLLGLLKAHLYNEFFDEIKTNLVCFMNPEVYGRSILENSSFLAPSNNPDPKLQGKGFVARLSGSTAEVLSMWHMMFFGKNIFRMVNNQLILKFEPILSKDFFDSQNTVKANLFGNIEVTYFNPRRLNTYEGKIVKIELISAEGKFVIDGDVIGSKLASNVREGYINKINIHIN